MEFFLRGNLLVLIVSVLFVIFTLPRLFGIVLVIREETIDVELVT